MDKIVNAICEKIQVSNDLLPLLIAFIVVVGTFFVRVFEDLLENAESEYPTCKVKLSNKRT